MSLGYSVKREKIDARCKEIDVDIKTSELMNYYQELIEDNEIFI